MSGSLPEALPYLADPTLSIAAASALLARLGVPCRSRDARQGAGRTSFRGLETLRVNGQRDGLRLVQEIQRPFVRLDKPGALRRQRVQLDLRPIQLGQRR